MDTTRQFANGGVAKDKAVFGFYPQLTGNRLTTHDTENKLRAGYTGESVGAPTAPAVTQTSIPSGNSAAGAGRGFVNPSVPSQPSLGITPSTSQITPGVSPTGGIAAAPSGPVQPAVAPNIASDISINGRGIGQQSYPAAQALATPTPATPAIQQGGVNYGDGSGNVGLGYAANLARKNAETGASSIFNTASRQTARDQLKAMDAQDLARTGNQSSQAIAKLNADTSLSNTRIGADTQRVGYGIQSQNNLANQQNAAARLGIDRTTADLNNQATQQKISAAQQMQDLQTKLLSAKPEERAGLIANMQALEGKYPQAPQDKYSHYMNETVDGKTGVLYNERTGQRVNQPQAQSISDNTAAIAIRDNKTMSIEQKREALKKLGYQ